jgi:hypothetical protein
MIGQSAVIAPSGELVAVASTLGDELITPRCDLDLGKRYRQTIVDFARHRQPGHYRLIVERKGATTTDGCAAARRWQFGGCRDKIRADRK